MIRNSLVGVVMLAFVFGVFGCGQNNAQRNDAPVKTTQGADPKTGKKSKTFEASIELPKK
jgi:hypothetical protein